MTNENTVVASNGADCQQRKVVLVSTGSRNNLCIPKIPSVIFDIELEESNATDHVQADHTVGVLLKSAERLLKPTSDEEYTLMCEVDSMSRSSSVLDATTVARNLGSMGYATRMRTALGGDATGGEYLHELRHVFVSCSPPAEEFSSNISGLQQFIVDPKFREQFMVARPTDRYASLVALVPEVFVGAEERLFPLVELLCSEMALSFATVGAVLPPWRHTSAMISKWRPRRSLDVPLDSDHMPTVTIRYPRARTSSKLKPNDLWPAAYPTLQPTSHTHPRQYAAQQQQVSVDAHLLHKIEGGVRRAAPVGQIAAALARMQLGMDKPRGEDNKVLSLAVPAL